METMEILNQALSIIVPAAATLLATWFAVLGAQMKAKYNEKINTETKRNIVNMTVEYVQQVYKELNGEEKLQKALEQASTLLMEKGINVSEVELRTLIESAVYGIKNGFNTLEIKASTPEQLTIPESMKTTIPESIKTTLVDVKTEA